MNNDELLELRRILLEANENSDWIAIQDAVEFVDEFIEWGDQDEV
jgi:hypothetical protein